MRSLLAAAAAVLLWGCGNGNIAGGGIEDGNGTVRGIVLSQSGSPAAGAEVSLVPADSAPTASNVRRFTTGEDGVFHADSIPAGSWRADIADFSKGSVISSVITVERSKTVSAGNLQLKRTGALRVHLKSPLQSPAQFYFPGTARIISAAAGDSVLLFTGLPEGVMPILKKSGSNLTEAQSAAVSADDTTEIFADLHVLYAVTYTADTAAAALWLADSLKRFGIDASVVSARELSPSLLNGFDAVILSGTSGSGEFESILAESPVPIIIQSGSSASVLGLCSAVQDIGWGRSYQSSASVTAGISELHLPMLPGSQAVVYTDGTDWVNPWAASFVGAVLPTDSAKALLFGVEKGTLLATGTPAADRRGFIWYQRIPSPEYISFLTSLILWNTRRLF